MCNYIKYKVTFAVSFGVLRQKLKTSFKVAKEKNILGLL